MDFSEHRGRVRRRRAARALALLAAASLILLAHAARVAAPLDEPFVGGLSFSGPTSGESRGHLLEPRRAGPLRGFQLMIAGTMRWSRSA